MMMKDLGKAIISIIFLVNNIFGPGMFALPMIFQQSGWLISFIIILFFFFSAYFASLVLIESFEKISSISNLHSFDAPTEYVQLISVVFGKIYCTFFQIIYYIALQSINIASIIVSAQALDHAIIFIFNRSFAFCFYPSFHFLSSTVNSSDLFGHENIVLSLGYIIQALIFVPLSFKPLEGNIKSVLIGFMISIFSLICFQFDFFSKPFNHEVPIIGSHFNQLIGICIFSLSYVTLIPSWYTMKKPQIYSIKFYLIFTTIILFIVYITLGFFGALSFPKLHTDNILNQLVFSKFYITRLSSVLIALGTVSPSIAVRSIILQNNLEIPKDVSYFTSSTRINTFFSIYFPWLFSFFWYESEDFAQFIQWTTLFSNSLINFIFPFLIYLKVLSFKSPDFTNSPEDPQTLKQSKKHSYLYFILISIMAILICFQITFNFYEWIISKNFSFLKRNVNINK